MPTVTYQVPANADDGYITASGSFQSGGTDLYLGYTGSSVCSSYARFTGVAIPKGATIISAKLQLRSSSARSGTSCKTRIFLNNADNASSPTTKAEYDGKATTTAYADWTIPATVGYTWYDSPSIKDAVQEVVNRAGWASGNAMLVLIKDNSSDYAAYRQYQSRENGASYAPTLVIEYSAGTDVTVTAATAEASAEALAATPHANVLVVGGTATASAEALPATPTTALIVLGAVASAVAEALPATPHADVVVQASVAEATAEALPATAVYNVHVTVLAATATASAEALPAEPLAQRNITVEAATGTATAEALAAVARSGKKLYYIIRYR